MRDLKKQKKGITLIALVITIIILLILAGVTISIVLNDGIMKKASVVKENTNNATEKELVSIAVTSARMNDKNNKMEINEENLRKELDASFGVYEYELNKISNGWELKIIKSGNQYEIEDNGFKELKKWYYTEDGMQITNGEQTLGLGDIVLYDSTKDINGDAITEEYISYKTKNGYEDQTFKASSYTGSWGVLGVDDNGNVLIMPSSTISSTTGKFCVGYNPNTDTTDELKIESCKNALQYIIDEIEYICDIYGYGKGAVDARSITLKDIDRYTLFNTKDFNKGLAYAFGNKVTYSCEKDGTITYSWDNNGNTIKETVEDITFTYLDLEKGEYKTLKKGESKEFTSNMYYYSIASGTYYNNCYNINNGKLWNLLFSETSSKYYYLATRFIGTAEGGIWNGVAGVTKKETGLIYLYDSDNYTHNKSITGVRPVISLGKYVNFGGNATDGWTIE